MSEEMRESFIKWYGGQAQYGKAHEDELWMTWQASRAALVVELPSDINGEYYADGWNAALMCVEERLKVAGVTYK